MRESALILRLFVIIAVLFSPIGNEIYAAAQLSGIINTTNSTLSGLTNTTNGLLSGITNTTNSTLSGLTNTTNSTVSSLSNLTDTLLFNNGTLITTVNGIVMKFQMDPSEPLQTTTSTVAYVLPQDVKTGDPKSAVTLEDPQAISGTVSSAPYRFTIPNFNSGTGSNNLLLVGVSANNANVASVTFGSAQLTKAVSSFQNNDAEFWYLVNPTGTNNIVVTLSGPASAVVGAYVFSGVNQASPIAGTAANYNPAGTPSSPTVSITTKYSNDMVIDLPSIFGGQLLGSPTCAQQWNANVPSEITGASSTTTVSSPGTVTCGWTANNGGDQWDDVAIEVRASGTTSTTAPSAPTSLVAAGGNAQISLSWSAPSSNGGSAITGYNVYRGTASGGETKYSSVSSSQTAYNDTSVTNGIKYYYEVTAVNAVGESARSGEASATPQTDATAPSAPTGLAATATSSSQINLSWTAPSSNGGSAITGYKVERSTDGTNWSTIAPNTGSASTSYSDAGLAATTTYYYRVSAINSVGTSGPSSVASTTTQNASTGSSDPIILSNAQSTSGTVSSSPYQFILSDYNVGTGTDRMLVVGVSANNANVASVTFGSAQLTKAVSSFQNNDAEFWYLVNPTGTGNIVVTLSGPASAVVGAYVFSGVNQASPIAGTAANYNPAGTPSSPTVSITTKYSSDLVADLPSIYGGQLLGSPTCAQQWNINIPSEITGASSTTTVSSPGTVTCGWTANNGGDQWDDVAIEVRASGTTATTAPSAPTSLTGTPGNGTVSLSWTAPSSNGGSSITNYKVYRSTSTGTETLLTTIGNVTSYTDAGLTNGVTYYYKITAINSVGESTQSSEISAIPTVPSTAPGSPTGLVAAGGNAQISLSWSAPSSDGGSAITGYNVYRGTASGGEGSTPVKTGITSTSYTDTGLTNGVTYYYTVKAVNSVGTSPASNEVGATPTVPSTAPGSPTGLVAAGGNAQISLSWSAPSSDGGSAITGYNVYRGTASGGETKYSSVSSSQTAYNDTSVTNGIKYYYEVTAVNAVGESARSGEASATPQTDATAPSAPTGLTANPGNGTVSLSWTTPSSNGGSTITGYNVYKGTTSGGETKYASVPASQTSYADTSVTNGIKYYYEVTAVNSVGTSPASNEVGATPATSPQPPTGLAATASSSSQINLSWTAPSSNGGSAITGYKVERSTDGTNWSTIAPNTGSASTSYSDAGLAATTTYYYRVSAINSVGTSGPSSVVNVKTQDPTYSIDQTKSGLVASDSLTNETESQNQLLSNGGYWRYMGDAQQEGAPYSVSRDSQGLHMGVAAPSDGKWAGFFAVSPNHNAQVWNAVISTPVRTTPSNYYDNGIYVQTTDGNINYVTCGSLTNSQATIWVVISTVGNTQQVTQFNKLWVDNSPNQPLTRDCTIITNGNNYLKVYLDGTLVYQNSSMSLQMPMPFNAYLEEETSYGGQMLTDTFQNYYVTTSEYVTLNDLPSGTTSVAIDESSGAVLATSPDDSGTSTLDVGQYPYPISGTLKVYDSNSQMATRSGTIYGGDAYSVN